LGAWLKWYSTYLGSMGLSSDPITTKKKERKEGRKEGRKKRKERNLKLRNLWFRQKETKRSLNLIHKVKKLVSYICD
jgi:hypothetical protein